MVGVAGCARLRVSGYGPEVFFPLIWLTGDPPLPAAVVRRNCEQIVIRHPSKTMAACSLCLIRSFDLSGRSNLQLKLVPLQR